LLVARSGLLAEDEEATGGEAARPGYPDETRLKEVENGDFVDGGASELLGLTPNARSFSSLR
jgi:hypothetical protein